MGTITRHGKGWRGQIRRRGHAPLSATFPLKNQAQAWVAQREAEIVQGRLGILPKHTLREALERFGREVSPKRAGARWERVRLAKLGRAPMASKALAALSEADIAEWRDKLLESVSGPSVRREMALLGAVLELARREWRWINASPMKGVKKPKPSAARMRGLAPAEIDVQVAALGYQGGRPANASQQVAVAFLLAIETGMRSGELLGLRWADVRGAHVHLPKTKNGDARDVPLSTRARELIDALEGLDSERLFTIDAKSRDALFRKARGAAKLSGFRFHDSRSEAISRLSKKLDIFELARMVGHRDLNSLLHYYRATPDEVAKKLG